MRQRTCVVFIALALAAGGAQAQPAFNGLRQTIAVDQFLAADAVGGTVTADGLTAMLIDALSHDDRFVVVERTGIASIQNEQALRTSNATTEETGAKTGQMLGANVIVRGAVIKYEAAAGGGSLGIGGLPLGSLFASQAGVKRQTSEIEVALRLIDTSTGQIVSTSTAKGTASANSAGATLVNPRTGAALDASAFSATPIGQAAQDAIVKAVDLIAAGMRNVPWAASVVDSSDGKIYVNAGADRNVHPGLTLVAYHKGKVLTDPSTGAVLDVEMARTGSIRIETVREKLSTASLLDGQLPARGDILKLK